MPKPPEKSRKRCDVWRFFPPCPGLFWGVVFHSSAGTFLGLCILFMASQFPNLPEVYIIRFSPASNNIHYSISSSTKNDFGTLFTQLHMFSRVSARGPLPTISHIWRVITVLTLSILQQSSSAKSRIPLAPNRPPSASEGRLEGQRPQPRCLTGWVFPSGEMIPNP